jgi:hypothetical protein
MPDAAASRLQRYAKPGVAVHVEACHSPQPSGARSATRSTGDRASSRPIRACQRPNRHIRTLRRSHPSAGHPCARSHRPGFAHWTSSRGGVRGICSSSTAWAGRGSAPRAGACRPGARVARRLGANVVPASPQSRSNSRPAKVEWNFYPVWCLASPGARWLGQWSGPSSSGRRTDSARARPGAASCTTRDVGTQALPPRPRRRQHARRFGLRVRCRRISGSAGHRPERRDGIASPTGRCRDFAGRGDSTIAVLAQAGQRLVVDFHDLLHARSLAHPHPAGRVRCVRHGGVRPLRRSLRPACAEADRGPPAAAPVDAPRDSGSSPRPVSPVTASPRPAHAAHAAGSARAAT